MAKSTGGTAGRASGAGGREGRGARGGAPVNPSGLPAWKPGSSTEALDDFVTSLGWPKGKIENVFVSANRTEPTYQTTAVVPQRGRGKRPLNVRLSVDFNPDGSHKSTAINVWKSSGGAGDVQFPPASRAIKSPQQTIEDVQTAAAQARQFNAAGFGQGTL